MTNRDQLAASCNRYGHLVGLSGKCVFCLEPVPYGYRPMIWHDLADHTYITTAGWTYVRLFGWLQ